MNNTKGELFHVFFTNGKIAPTVIIIIPITGMAPGIAVIALTMWSTGMVFTPLKSTGIKNMNEPKRANTINFMVSKVFFSITVSFNNFLDNLI